MTREGRHIHTTSLHARLVAVLFFLAATAESVAFAPASVRRATLVVLLRCEALAYSIVYWSLRDCGANLAWALPDAVRHETCPEAAIALADWFRVLAVALRDLPRRTMIEKRRRSALAAALKSRGAKGSEMCPAQCDRSQGLISIFWPAPIPDT